MSTTPTATHPHTAMLRTIYADLTQLRHYVTDDVVLHPADRAIHNHTDRHRPSRVTGKDAVVAHEHALLELTGNTLAMGVTDIITNDYFGAVLGTLHASHPCYIATPFCGLWRFNHGRIAEHWENAYDPTVLAL